MIFDDGKLVEVLSYVVNFFFFHPKWNKCNGRNITFKLALFIASGLGSEASIIYNVTVNY